MKIPWTCDKCGKTVENLHITRLVLVEITIERGRTIERRICSNCHAEFRQWWYNKQLPSQQYPRLTEQ